MSSVEFDPFHKWLGIPPAEQPPTHYRLLQLPVGEQDTAKIAAVATKLTAYCQARSKGQNGAHALRVLDAVNAAKACLLDPHAKADYDASLGLAPVNGHAEGPIEAELLHDEFAPVTETAPSPAAARSAPAPTPQSAGEESFFDGMDFGGPLSTGPKKPTAKAGAGKAATSKTATKAVAKTPAKPAAKAGAKKGKSASGGLQPWHMYAMAGGGIAVFIGAVALVSILSSGEPKKETVVKNDEPKSQFHFAQYNTSIAAQETAQRTHTPVPVGRPFIEAPITRDGDFFFADVTINGKAVGRFLLDTGAPITVIKKAVADQLGLKETSSSKIAAVGGPQTVSYRKVESLKIKDAHWEELEPAAMDLAPWEKELGVSFVGVIGRDVWAHVMFALDPGENKLTIYNRDKAPMNEDAPFLTGVDERPCIDVKLDGGPDQLYLIATGCKDALMKIDDSGAGGEEKIGKLQVVSHRFNKKINDEEPCQLGHDQSDLTQTALPANHPYQTNDARQKGVLGAPILSQYMVVMDLARNKIQFTPPHKK